MLLNSRGLVVVAVAAVLGTFGYAYMASNTVAPTGAGEGSGTVSGYTINHMSYSDSTAAAGCPGDGSICRATFSVEAASPSEPPAATVYAAFFAGTTAVTPWTACTETGGVQGGSSGSQLYPFTTWSCDFTNGVVPGSITSLQVRATS